MWIIQVLERFAVLESRIGFFFYIQYTLHVDMRRVGCIFNSFNSFVIIKND